MKKNVLRVILILFISHFIKLDLNAQEDKFRALFIYNFTKYVDWPDNSNNDFIIIIVGKSAIEEELKTIASKMKVGTKTIVVKTVSSINEISNAQIVYIPLKNNDLATAVTKAKTSNTLLVCNSPNSCQQGACINFIVKNGNLSFEISYKNIKSNGLQVNSSLLALGTTVD